MNMIFQAKMGELGVATNSQKLEGSQNAKITKRKSHTSNRKPVGSAEQPVEKVSSICA